MRPFIKLALIVCIFCSSFSAVAQDTEIELDQYILDDAKIIDSERLANLNRNLPIFRQHGRVIAVHTVPDFDPGSAEMTLQAYADDMLAGWIDQDPNHGRTVLFVVSPDQQDFAITIGTTLDPDIYGPRIASVLEGFSSTAFEPQNVSSTIGTAVSQINARLLPNWEPDKFSAPSGYTLGFGPFAVAALILVAIAGVMWNRIANFFLKYIPCPQCGNRTLTRTEATLREATYSMSGEKLISTRCSSCGYEKTRKKHIRAGRNANDGHSGFR
ncbi:MAG: TPM domain-containing protein [Pseudomonadota bacterium]